MRKVSTARTSPSGVVRLRLVDEARSCALLLSRVHDRTRPGPPAAKRCYISYGQREVYAAELGQVERLEQGNFPLGVSLAVSCTQEAGTAGPTVEKAKLPLPSTGCRVRRLRTVSPKLDDS